MIKGQPDKALHVHIEFGTKTAAGGGLNDSHLLIFKPQQTDQFFMVVMGILGGSEYDKGTVIIHIPGTGIRLQIAVLDIGGLVGLFDNRRTLPESFVDIAFLYLAAEKQIALFVDFRRSGRHRFRCIKHCRQCFIGHFDGLQCAFCRRLGFSRNQGNRFTNTADFAGGQQRLIFVDDTGQIFTGNIFGSKHTNDAADPKCLFIINPLDIGMRLGAPQDPQDKRIVELQIGAENRLSP